MTMDIEMLKAISDGAQIIAAQADQMAEGAKQMAESMRAVVEDCAQQTMERRKAGISEQDALSEAFNGIKPDACCSQPQETPSGATQGHTPETGALDTASQTFAANNSSDEPPLDLVTLRTFVVAKSTPEKRAKIKAILRKYGAEKLTELKEEAYPSVKTEVGALRATILIPLPLKFSTLPGYTPDSTLCPCIAG